MGVTPKTGPSDTPQPRTPKPKKIASASIGDVVRQFFKKPETAFVDQTITSAPKPKNAPLLKEKFQASEEQIREAIAIVKKVQASIEQHPTETQTISSEVEIPQPKYETNKNLEELSQFQAKIASLVGISPPALLNEISVIITTLKELYHSYDEKNKTQEGRRVFQNELIQIEKEIYNAKKNLVHLVGVAKADKRALQRLSEVPKPAIKQIAKGKAKAVWLKESDKTSVYYTAVGQQKAKIEEIKEEIVTANVIRNNLYASRLMKLMRNVSLLKGQENQIAKTIIDKYGSIETFIERMNQEDVNTLKQKLALTQQQAKELNNLKPKILDLLKEELYLAVDIREAPSEEKVADFFTAKSEKAEGDLEDAIRGQLSLEQRALLASDHLKGTRNAHEAGFILGDIKPENVLVYKVVDETGKEQLRAKNSDFGKSVFLLDKSKLHTGNARFEPPEGRISKQGEVASMAYTVIRILEEPLLQRTNKKMLIDLKPEQTKPGITADEKRKPKEMRRGIERFLVQNKSTPQNETLTLKGKFTVFSRRAESALKSISSPSVGSEEAQFETHRYIDELTKQLVDEMKLDAFKATELNILLKEMTLSNPAQRPNMEQVASRFDAIGLF